MLRRRLRSAFFDFQGYAALPVDAGEANRNQVRTAKFVGGGQAGDAVGVEESRQFRL